MSLLHDSFRIKGGDPNIDHKILLTLLWGPPQKKVPVILGNKDKAFEKKLA